MRAAEHDRDIALARAERAETELTTTRAARQRAADVSDERAAASIASGNADGAGTAATLSARVAEEQAAGIAAAREKWTAIRAALPALWASHDGPKLLDALKSLSLLGNAGVGEARDDAMKLALDINADVQGPAELHLPMQVFYAGLGDPGIRDLMTWSLENQAATPPEFRDLSVWSLPYALPAEESIARFDAALAAETDRGVEVDIVKNLGAMNLPKAEAVLVRVLGESSRDLAVRAEAAIGIATSRDSAAQRAIDAAAAAESDPRFQTALRISQVVRDPPASGCLIVTATPEGAATAAGMRPGDLILSYNGKPVPSDGDLRREATSQSTAELVPVVIVRDGHEQTIQIKPGRLGITPRAVTKK